MRTSPLVRRIRSMCPTTSRSDHLVPRHGEPVGCVDDIGDLSLDVDALHQMPYMPISTYRYANTSNRELLQDASTMRDAYDTSTLTDY
jgi:hypothetical protein